MRSTIVRVIVVAMAIRPSGILPGVEQTLIRLGKLLELLHGLQCAQSAAVQPR